MKLIRHKLREVSNLIALVVKNYYRSSSDNYVYICKIVLIKYSKFWANDLFIIMLCFLDNDES